jgi:predicted Rossmann fold flavoprotein
MSPEAVHKFDVLVLGAGAAGLMCAIEAGKRGRRIAILELADRAGKKILISGGGRCNFTNIYSQPEHFLSENPHFCKSALACYTPADFIALIEKHNIPYHEKVQGQLFCDRSAEDVVTMLEAECRAAGVQFFFQARIVQTACRGGFVVRTEAAEFQAPALVVATGGLSIPKMGATTLGYEIARQFGLAVVPTRPALVPFVFDRGDREQYCDLTGLSLEVSAAAGAQSFQDKMLITHRGLSGPAILQISSYWKETTPICLDIAPGRDIAAVIRSTRIRTMAGVQSALQTLLPRRFARRWLELHPPVDWSDQGLASLDRAAHGWAIAPAGTEGYEKAEVTAGGVDTGELFGKTMESAKVPGLFFVGEVVDVTGHLGGHNFQWAWASGAAAGRAC